MCVHVLPCVVVRRTVPRMPKTRLALRFNGTKLRQCRERRGWHQIDLADACEKAGWRVSRARISRLETGAGSPSPPTLAVLVKVFEFENERPLVGGVLPRPKVRAR